MIPMADWCVLLFDLPDWFVLKEQVPCVTI